MRLIAAVEEDVAGARTRVSFRAPPRVPAQVKPVTLAALAHALVPAVARRGTAAGSGAVLEIVRDVGDPTPPATAGAPDRTLSLLGELRPALAPVFAGALAAANLNEVALTQVWALRVRAPLFGHNAPKEFTGIEGGIPQFEEWRLDEVQEVKNKVCLDAPSAKAAAGDWAVVDYRGLDYAKDAHVPDGAAMLITTVEGVEPGVSRQGYGMAASVLRLTLAKDWFVPMGREGQGIAIIRNTVVYTSSEELALAEQPFDDPVGADVLELDGLYQGIRPGRVLVVAGERVDVPGTSGVPAAEVVRVAAVAHGAAKKPGEKAHTYVHLARPLRHAYRRLTLVVYGNVAHATNGESRAEILGAGDARQPLQRFSLRQPPLTYLSAPTPSGLASTLEVRVNDVRWPAVGSLAELGAADRGYVTQAGEGAVTSVTFGDGEHGARLPTGAENVRARYRNGIGAAANVGPGRITLLATKPLGVKDVANPVPATGGADPDRRDQARANAAVALHALDRLVSVRDYADFARSFAGIGKASASRVLDGRRRVVFVTVAGAGDIPIDETSDLLANLRLGLRRWGDPELPVVVGVRELLLADLGIAVAIDPDFDWVAVQAAIRSRLVDVLGLDSRQLGQDLTESEILQSVHDTPGVVRCRLDRMQALRYDDGSVAVVGALTVPGPPAAPFHPGRRVVAEEARASAAGALPAQLLYLSATIAETLELTSEAP
jgi:predicted phage baseplate assembly protein